MRFALRPWSPALIGRILAASFTSILATSCAKRAPEDQAPPITTVQGPAGAIHIDDGGQGGLPVVFVHSFGGDSGHWKKQLEHLRPTRRAVALDLRGHGQSAAPTTESYFVRDFASDIEAVVDELGFERFALVGHSLGGAAALQYAADHPDKVAGLVLAGTPGRTPPEQAQHVLDSLQTNYEGVTRGYWEQLLTDATPEVRTQVEAGMTSVPKPVTITIIRDMFAMDPAPALEKYTGPKLVIVTPPADDPNALHNLGPAVPHVVMTGTSHWMHMDKPDEFNRILDDFLARLAT